MKRKLTWLAGWLCAALALGLVFWLHPDTEKKGEVAAEGNGPQVTKPYPRERDAREVRTKNPREEFEAARKRGLTEEEVRGIVEDFLEAGLSVASDVDLLTKRAIQQRWYLNTLVDGFGLTGKQKRIAKMRLREALLDDHAAYVLSGESGEVITTYSSPGSPFLTYVDDPLLAGSEAIEIPPAARMLDVSLWLGLGKLAPWFLCDLDDGQRELSWFGSENAWLSGRPMGARTKDAGTDEHYEDLDDPFAENLLTFTAAGAIFPLSMVQVDRIRSASKTYRVSNGLGVKRPGLVDEVKCLTSPQLRTLLLFRPEMAETLMKELGE